MTGHTTVAALITIDAKFSQYILVSRMGWHTVVNYDTEKYIYHTTDTKCFILIRSKRFMTTWHLN